MTPCKLSPRKQELLTFLANGLTLKEAARRMGISSNTTKRYMNEIRWMLDAQTKEQALALAFKKGWIILENVIVPEPVG